MSILLLQLNRTDGDSDTYYLKSCRRYHIGRGSQCEIRILDMKLSRRHCAIEMIGGQWLLLDCGSTNGVKLNGEKIRQTARLRPDAIIEAGSSTLVVKSVEGLDSSDAFAVADNIGDVTGPQTAQIIDTTALEPSSSASRPAIIVDEDLTPSHNDARQNDENMRNAVTQNEDDEECAPDVTSDHAHGDDLAVATEDERESNVTPDRAMDAAPTPTPEPRVEPVPQPQAEPPPLPEPAIAHAPEPDTAPDDAITEPSPDSDKEPLEAGSVRHVGSDTHGRPITLRVGSVGKHSPATSAPDSTPAERTVIITLLGKKIGPIPRSVARDLKARELRGLLNDEELRDHPRPA